MALIALLAGTARAADARPVAVPLTLDYATVTRALDEHVFAGADGQLELLRDAGRCNRLAIADPRVDGHADGRIRVTLALDARGGTPLGDRCLLPFTWSGTIELLQSAQFTDRAGLLAFRVSDSRVLPAGGAAGRGVPGALWDWIKGFVHPRLDTFHIDLAPLLEATTAVIEASMPDTPARAHVRETLALADAQAREAGLEVVLGFSLPEMDAPPVVRPAAPLTPDELAAWDGSWQAWDAFATWTVKTFAQEADDALRAELVETLERARFELRDALARDVPAADPVRELFRSTWQRLSPLVAAAAHEVDSAAALRYLAFISAADALAALDSAAQHLGVRIDSAGLRAVARALVPEVDPAELSYGLAPDPELRRLYGLPALLPEIAQPLTRRWHDWLLAAAHADAAPTVWLPSRAGLDEYLERLDALLATTIAASAEAGRVDAAYVPVYRTLVRATAWQESCWRQFVERAGEVEPIRSHAGSVGLMQINKHVWRGLYDLDRLERDIAYNARAGDEILIHYLVDYAIRKKEHEVTGELDNLARATYAAYNGGPAQLRRYRNAKTPDGLRAIDRAFWDKYRAMQRRGAEAVRQCYTP